MKVGIIQENKEIFFIQQSSNGILEGASGKIIGIVNFLSIVWTTLTKLRGLSRKKTSSSLRLMDEL